MQSEAGENNRKNRMSTVLLVGAHKSGTSAFAGAMNALGVNMGEDLLSADDYNVYGHFEDVDFIKMNEKILDTAEGSWHHPPSRLKIRHAASLAQEEMKALLAKKTEQAQGHTWGWKDPRTSLTISAWLPLIDNPKIIVCRRSADNTVKSLVRRDKNNAGYDCTPEYARLLTDYYNDEISATLFSLPHDRYMQLTYEDLIHNTKATINTIANYLDIKTNPIQRRRAVKSIKKH